MTAEKKDRIARVVAIVCGLLLVAGSFITEFAETHPYWQVGELGLTGAAFSYILTRLMLACIRSYSRQSNAD